MSVASHMDIDEVITRYHGGRTHLISVLQDLQAEFHWLPPEMLAQVAQKMGVSLAELFGIVTFYKSFRLKPRGKHLITVCMGTACHVRGAPRILRELETQLQISSEETTPDQFCTLETARCLGACALGPIVVCDEEYEGQMTKAKVATLLEHLRKETRP
ncbi:MAG: NAD(P)H-dependent oxidoreductase subunit E [Candidatus Bipolaricaulota bacterium]|nr:NAD(P)H-dependent oxidoreductase subunit E [Candidatus Bipolaricaulota bacterium]MDW8140821.1 NAD(P)H-dependent oxidoreductase subunit E [Candidatus Bipolaricaulota bacterium]